MKNKHDNNMSYVKLVLIDQKICENTKQPENTWDFDNIHIDLEGLFFC